MHVMCVCVFLKWIKSRVHTDKLPDNKYKDHSFRIVSRPNSYMKLAVRAYNNRLMIKLILVRYVLLNTNVDKITVGLIYAQNFPKARNVYFKVINIHI